MSVSERPVLDADVEARRVEALRIERGPADAPRLVALLADEDWRVRKQAAAAATHHLGDESVVRALLHGLVQEEDVGLRNAAVEAFARASPERGAEVARVLSASLEVAPRTARKFVCAALVGGGASSVPALGALAAEEDVMTAAAAVEALAAIARAGAAPAEIGALLVRALERPEPVLRLAAIDGLVAAGVVVDASSLAGALADPVTSTAALGLLAVARGEGVTEQLLGALGRRHSTVLAALALVRRGEPSSPARLARLREVVAGLAGPVRERLIDAVASRPLDEARAVARLLLDAAELRALPAVVELGVRAELDPACRASFVALGDAAVEPLLELAEARAADDVSVAAWALEAASDLALLGRRGDARGPHADRLAALSRELLARGEEVAAKAAARALGTWGGPDDAAALAARAGVYGMAFEAVLAHALEQLAARAPGGAISGLPPRLARRSVPPAARAGLDSLRRALASDDALERAGALDALEVAEAPDAVELATLALADEDERVQVAALRLLSRVRGSEGRDGAARAARLCLESASSSVRAQALATLSLLGAFGPAGGDDALAAHLEDASPQVVIAALRAVAISGVRGAATEAGLERALAHSDPEVVKEALGTVGRRDDALAVTRAAACLAHPHWSVRARAAEVLAALGGAAARAALEARARVEPDELVRRTIDAGLSGAGATP